MATTVVTATAKIKIKKPVNCVTVKILYTDFQEVLEPLYYPLTFTVL